jgi:DNA polymerase (family X)
MRNAEIAAALDELGTLYELDGAVRYRVNAYRDAARTVRECPLSVEELARAGRATELPGIGKTLEEKILALVDSGEIPAAVKLKKKFPPTLIAVTRVPGLGAKTARRLFDELEIASLDDLKSAAEDQQIRGLKGLGQKAEENILAALEGMADVEDGGAGRLLLSEVLPVAGELAAALREHPAAHQVEVAGSARRLTDTCKDIDLIATASDPKTLAEHMVQHPLIATGSGGRNGARALTHNGIPVDLRIVEPDAFGNLLQHFTGSAAHNIQLREDAVARGFSVSEHGVTETEGGTVHRCATEEEVYELLGYSFIEPELREGRGELKAARDGGLPELIELGDIRGDLHCHTTLSDGHNSLEEMADAARERRYSYLAVTDHSATHGFGDHVTAERLWERIEEVRDLDAKLPRFHLLAGSEVNIGTDGSLDYPEELLAALDWVIASVHTSFSNDQKFMTGRVLEAIENPLVDCIGHLTGRMLGRREPYPIDVEAVAEAAARTGTMLEINGNPNRRDLSDRHARLAAEAGAMIVLNTDAHRTRTLDNMPYAVATARRAWLTKQQVANTRGWRDFARLRKPARSATPRKG